MFYFDPEKICFYHTGVHEIPAHAVPITGAQYEQALNVPHGFMLSAGEDGQPFVVPQPAAVTPVHLLLSGLREQVNAIYQQRMATIADGYPSHERESWSVQVEEAKALQADPAAATKWLDACAAARGVDKTELAARVLAKDVAYRLISGTLSGIRQRHEDAIAKLETVEQAQGYDMQAWWPE